MLIDLLSTTRLYTIFTHSDYTSDGLHLMSLTYISLHKSLASPKHICVHTHYYIMSYHLYAY